MQVPRSLVGYDDFQSFFDMRRKFLWLCGYLRRRWVGVTSLQSMEWVVCSGVFLRVEGNQSGEICDTSLL
jgi:hypothetical protein